MYTAVDMYYNKYIHNDVPFAHTALPYTEKATKNTSTQPHKLTEIIFMYTVS